MIKSELINKLRKITPEEKSILEGKGIDKSIYMSTSSKGAIDVVDFSYLTEKGKLIDIRPHTRFVHFPKHKHNFAELVYMCEGKTTHIIGDKRIELCEGELLFLSQNSIQEILPAGENDIAVNLIIRPQFFEKVLKLLGSTNNLISEFLIGCLGGNTSADFLHFKVSGILPVQNLMENMIWSLTNNQPNKRSINETTMSLLFMQLLNLTDKIDIGKDSPEEKIFIKVLDYIEKNYRDGSLSALSDELGIEISALSRVIKKISGLTFTELMKKKRLNQACWLLKNTKFSIDEIALNVGYENKSYFYRIFEEIYGKTPSAYRKD